MLNSHLKNYLTSNAFISIKWLHLEFVQQNKSLYLKKLCFMNDFRKWKAFNDNYTFHRVIIKIIIIKLASVDASPYYDGVDFTINSWDNKMLQIIKKSRKMYNTLKNVYSFII